MLYNQIILSDCIKSRSNFDFFKELTKLDCYDVVNRYEDLIVLEDTRFKEWMKLKDFIIFGTGGSSLGGQCIHSISNGFDKNLRFMRNLDSSTLSDLFTKINLENTGFLFISKSGETLETISQLLLIMDFAKNLSNFKNRFVIITENKESTLKEIANQNDFLCFDHPKTIGGRYSIFSLVGMVPAVLCGINPRSIRIGGRRVLDNFGNSIHKIQEGAEFVFQNFKRKIFNHVSFIYSEKLEAFGRWLAQLYAESSGKDGKGITPITAFGSEDQHSQLQLYLDGPKDKCFTFFYEKQDKPLAIKNLDLPVEFEYLKDKKVSAIFGSQCKATERVLLEKNIDVRRIEIPAITPEILGALFMHFMLEVACVCKLIEVDPFDQPAVEKGKIITKQLLGENQ